MSAYEPFLFEDADKEEAPPDLPKSKDTPAKVTKVAKLEPGDSENFSDFSGFSGSHLAFTRNPEKRSDPEPAPKLLLSQPTATTTGARPVAPATVVTVALPTCTEPPELEPKDRLCYQCQHFQRSPYGFPLGLCAEHGMPEGAFSDARGNRIQHATSQPAKFGCVDFSLRAPDTDVCTVCRHYHPDSTMCDAVNTGCPYPAIPPCTGAHFEAVEVAS